MQVENSKMIYRGSNELARVYRGDHVIVWEPGSGYPYEDQYLTFEVAEQWEQSPMFFNFYHPSGLSIDVEFSVNDGEWKQFSSATTADKAVSVGDTVRVRGNNRTYTFQSGIYLYDSYLEISGAYYNIYGNIMSLVHGDSFFRKRRLYEDNCFSHIFEHKDGYCISAENLCLPASRLTQACYSSMFNEQFRLQKAPQLRAKRLSRQCYSHMFYYCSSLTTAPELPATSLEYGCYEYMFFNCSSLTAAPDLLTEVLDYSFVYYQMFRNCTSLNYVKCLATNANSNRRTELWLQNVAANGTFVKHPNAVWETGSSGIPSGWTVVYASA